MAFVSLQMAGTAPARAVTTITIRLPRAICKIIGHAHHRRIRIHCQCVSAQDAASVASLSLELPKIVYAVAAGADHDSPGHPECAARVPAILEALQAGQLTADARPQQLINLKNFRNASFSEVTAIHSEQYVKVLEEVILKQAPTRLDADTYVTSSSFNDAMKAAGAAVTLVDAVVEASAAREASATGTDSGSTTGFGICRPPGHHAIPKGPMGFCLFGTVAIAARYAQQHHNLQRVMIFDFDVHHGNGTHDTFYEDSSVLFVSTHQAGSFPNTGALKEIGKGDGEGTSINLPIPGDSGDAAMRAAFDEVVGPAAERFQPDIILVSAGFDAHWRDPLAGLQMRTATYHTLASNLKQLADRLCSGRLVFLLEGGYDLKALGDSVADTFRGVLGDGSQDKFNPDLLRDEPADKVRAVLQEARRIHGL